jgi:arylsulfatase A-like enzyme
VRFVQICTGNQNWDHHGNITKALPNMCRKVDRPSAALVVDLKRRGLLDSTVVFWSGEMGRLPVIQNEKNVGRDHNTHGFSAWAAGGGVKAGHVHGATDEFGLKAVEDVVNHSDLHATLLHLFGLDPATLAFERPSGPASLIDGQEARVVTGLLA